MSEYPKTKRISTSILIAIIFFVFGMYVGTHGKPEVSKVNTLTGKENTVVSQTDFNTFWKAWNTINDKFPGAEKISDQDRIYGAISGLMTSLNDPYSIFFPPEEAKMFADEIAGNFSGVGMEVGMKDKVLTVIAPLKGTPAFKAGIKPGDKILKIDKTVTSGLTVDKAIKLIRGEKGTTVVLYIFSEGDKEPREVKIVRDTINTPTLDTETKGDVFVIKLYTFSEHSAELFRTAIETFQKTGGDKLVLDLRGNPGGYLDSAADIASWFLPGGKVVVTEDSGGKREPVIFRSKGYNIFSDKLKFVILLNGGSASASEIVAGAMQDQGRAKLVGEQSYGKGSVQEVVKLTPDTIMKITIAKWLTPNGTSISLKGLTPDVKVEMTRKDLEAKKDPQMDKALELLHAWTPIEKKATN